jgi:hypothetical protein
MEKDKAREQHSTRKTRTKKPETLSAKCNNIKQANKQSYL